MRHNPRILPQWNRKQRETWYRVSGTLPRSVRGGTSSSALCNLIRPSLPSRRYHRELCNGLCNSQGITYFLSYYLIVVKCPLRLVRRWMYYGYINGATNFRLILFLNLNINQRAISWLGIIQNSISSYVNLMYLIFFLISKT